MQLFLNNLKKHQVLGYVHEKYVPTPVNITTVNINSGDINNEDEMIDWLTKYNIKNTSTQSQAQAKNSKEMAISRVGHR